MRKINVVLLLLSLLVLSTGCTNLVMGYKIKGDKVYFHSLNGIIGTTESEVVGADAASFKELSDPRFGRDKKHVYMAGEVVTQADPSSFKMIQEYNALGMSRYARDARYVFMDGEIIPGADPATFRHLKGEYAIDKHRAYWYDLPVTNRIGSFSIIGNDYARDSLEIYLKGEALNVCSADRFDFVFPAGNEADESALNRWARDGCFYYYGKHKFTTADYGSVTVFRESLGILKDSRTAYHEGRDLLFDLDGNRILDTLDAASFTVDRLLTCHDQFGPINVFCGRQVCDI